MTDNHLGFQLCICTLRIATCCFCCQSPCVVSPSRAYLHTVHILRTGSCISSICLLLRWSCPLVHAEHSASQSQSQPARTTVHRHQHPLPVPDLFRFTFAFCLAWPGLACDYDCDCDFIAAIPVVRPGSLSILSPYRRYPSLRKVKGAAPTPSPQQTDFRLHLRRIAVAHSETQLLIIPRTRSRTTRPLYLIAPVRPHLQTQTLCCILRNTQHRRHQARAPDAGFTPCLSRELSHY